jgi:ribosomal protein S18 acetylase RimI-like enzyme
MKNDEIALRRGRPADHAAMKAILRATFESTWRAAISAAAAEAYLAADRAGAYVDRFGGDFWVAERDGEIIGLAHWRGDFIDALHVRPGHARRGIGRLLLARAEQEIAKARFAQVWLETDTFNEGACAFYAAQGYTETDRYPDQEWNSGLTTIAFVKSLGARCESDAAQGA